MYVISCISSLLRLDCRFKTNSGSLYSCNVSSIILKREKLRGFLLVPLSHKNLTLIIFWSIPIAIDQKKWSKWCSSDISFTKIVFQPFPLPSSIFNHSTKSRNREKHSRHLRDRILLKSHREITSAHAKLAQKRKKSGKWYEIFDCWSENESAKFKFWKKMLPSLALFGFFMLMLNWN